jgi:hypothetical protein
LAPTSIGSFPACGMPREVLAGALLDRVVPTCRLFAFLVPRITESPANEDDRLYLSAPP